MRALVCHAPLDLRLDKFVSDQPGPTDLGVRIATVLNVVCSVTKTNMGALMKGIWPFLLAEMAVLLALILFPEIVMIPARFFGV